jgi:hypothetical protein
LKQVTGAVGTAGRVVLLVATVAFATIVLGLGLNWIYDPSHVT